MVLGSFYWGYVCTNVLGGMAAERYGPRLVLGLGVLCCSILSVLSPFAAQVSSNCFIAIRILEGAFQVSFLLENAIQSVK